MKNNVVIRELAELLCKLTGNEFPESKFYLIEDRLKVLLKELRISNLPELLERLKSSKETLLKQKVIDLMTTHETMFFRDQWPFRYLAETVTKMRLLGLDSPIRIWSAGCSTGMEAYSIAIALVEAGLESYEFEVIASDISQISLKQAREGVYPSFDLYRSLSAKDIEKYFQPEGSDKFRIRKDFRTSIQFVHENLVELEPKSDRFDFIFCRYVLIYFNDSLRRQIIKHFHRHLTDEGVLIFGSVEALNDRQDDFVRDAFHPCILKKAA